ncbi:IS3 family transposase [Pseudoduganella flava]|uniref:IS3 family transposase n=1 Tax=Pseudoduganella flava TaxID=871742 RepID=UPI001E5166BE|nr:IS3 family transposase [Pseudoduganella flava]
MEKYRKRYPVKALCRALRVSRSGFYASQQRLPSQRSQEDQALRAHILRIHQSHRQALGAVKTWKVLKGEGIDCGKHQVARLRRLDGIEASRKAKFRVMHAHQHTEPPAPDLLKRAFMVPMPNKVWAADITTINTREGWLHLAIVLDLFARRVVGWAMSARQNADLPIAAMIMAFDQRQPAAGLICHTDQGSVYGSKDYRTMLEEHGVRPSMSRRGNCHDNAVVESWFSTVKNELTRHRIFATRAAAIAEISDYIELYYNLRRPHQTLGYRSPIEVEKRHAMPN